MKKLLAILLLLNCSPVFSAWSDFEEQYRDASQELISAFEQNDTLQLMRRDYFFFVDELNYQQEHLRSLVPLSLNGNRNYSQTHIDFLEKLIKVQEKWEKLKRIEVQIAEKFQNTESFRELSERLIESSQNINADVKLRKIELEQAIPLLNAMMLMQQFQNN